MFNPEGAGVLAAENYARFFLRHPLVAGAYVFGSVALRGDGHDVDMVVEVPRHLGFQFLTELHEMVESFIKIAEIHGSLVQDDYENLKMYRRTIAYGILGMEDGQRRGRLMNIAWRGKLRRWDNYCNKKKWGLALQIEEQYYRPLDLFLMPQGWQNSEGVAGLLPNWVSARPWAKRSFYRIMVLQARKYNPDTRHFDKRVKGNKAEEQHLQEALEEEQKFRKTKSPKK